MLHKYAAASTQISGANEAALRDFRAQAREATQRTQRRLDAARKRRLAAHTAEEPTVRIASEDGSTVAVALCGTRGAGREMLLDEDDWEDISTRLGTRWVIEPQHGLEGLCVCREGTDPVVPLASHLVDVGPGEMIHWRNHDLTDLRRANLRVVKVAVAMAYDYKPPRLPRLTTEGTSQSARQTTADSPAIAAATVTKAPGPHVVLKDNVPCMSVPLHGEHGEGRRAILDLLDWERVKMLAGEDWHVRQPASGLSVVSYRQQAKRLTGERDGSAEFLVLARFVAGAGEDEVVSYRDSDPFHIRRSSLVVSGRTEHWNMHRAPPRQATR